MTPARAPSSKQFLIDRIVNQAKLDNVPLTDVEIRMLGFAEASASAKDMEAAQAFERDFDDEEYETKIATLIRHAHDLDEKTGKNEAWDEALARIAGRDLYIHVMLERAGLEKSGPAALLGDWRFIVYGLLLVGLPFVAAVIIGFSPFGTRLIRSDTLRLLVAALLLAAPFVISKLTKRGSTKRKS
jgi:hypothetical protein